MAKHLPKDRRKKPGTTRSRTRGKRSSSVLTFESLNLPLIRVDREGKILDANNALLELTGYSASEFMVQEFFEAVKTHPASENLPSLSSALRNGTSWTGCVHLQRRGAEQLGLVLKLEPEGEGRPEFDHLVATFFEIPQCVGAVADFAQMAERFSTVVDGSMAGLMVVQEGKILFANAAAAEIFGYETSQPLKGKDFLEYLHPGSKTLVSLDDSAIDPASPLTGKDIELKGLRKDGSVVDIDLGSRRILWNGKRAILLSFRDVTERKRLEREQATWFWEQEVLGSIDRQLVSEIDLPKMLEIIALHAKSLTRADWIGILLYQRGTKRAQWKVVLGESAKRPDDVFHQQFLADLLKESLDPIFVPDIREAIVESVYQQSVFGAERLVSVGWFPFEFERKIRGYLVAGYRKPHGFSSREVRLLGSLAEKAALTLSSTDLYENLRRHQKELEFLSSARIQAQEEERRRIATELHDGLGQILTAIKFNFEILEDTLSLNDDELRRFDNAKKLIEHAMREAREISYNLRPSILDDFGLVPALNYLSEHMSKQYHREVDFRSHSVDGRLDRQTETALYRIAQEALTNSIRHGQARHVDIQLIGIEKSIRLIIEDNGVGFDLLSTPGRGPGFSGIGLVSMRERVHSLLGHCDIESRPGKGTTIIVEVPLKTEEANEKDSNTAG